MRAPRAARPLAAVWLRHVGSGQRAQRRGRAGQAARDRRDRAAGLGLGGSRSRATAGATPLPGITVKSPDVVYILIVALLFSWSPAPPCAGGPVLWQRVPSSRLAALRRRARRATPPRGSRSHAPLNVLFAYAGTARLVAHQGRDARSRPSRPVPPKSSHSHQDAPSWVA